MDTTTVTRPLYRAIASLLLARENCKRSGNTEWYDRHSHSLYALCDEHLPSGSGLDAGTTLDARRSTSDRLVFTTSFHHMDASGVYDGWTDHDVIVTPSLLFDIDIRISGRDRNDVKEYLAELFGDVLTRTVEG